MKCINIKLVIEIWFFLCDNDAGCHILLVVVYFSVFR